MYTNVDTKSRLTAVRGERAGGLGEKGEERKQYKWVTAKNSQRDADCSLENIVNNIEIWG